MTDTNTIRTACEEFLKDWNRRDWMSEHGEWNEDDEIEEGVIDPDGVEDDADALEVGSSWQGWDCREGWRAYQHGTALYLNWWRTPYPHTPRHERDLYVLVSSSFFEEEEESDAA